MPPSTALQPLHNPSSTLDQDEDDLLEDEDEVDKAGLIDWKKVLTWKTWLKKKYIPYYIAFVIISILVVLMTVYHEKIVTWLKPAGVWMKDLSYGWIIPIGILFVISFPPLGGHEIVVLLCGVVWGLWKGFAIAAAGTFLGELGNFFTFRYCFRARAQKIEQKDVMYACLAHVIREGGFIIALLARLSAIPGHFTTVVFSTCGINFWVFILATLLSLPKQLIIVYLGVIFGDTGKKTTKSRIISDSVLAVSFLVTIVAALWIWRKMKQARPVVQRERRRLERIKRAEGKSSVPLSTFPDFPEDSESLARPSDQNLPRTNYQLGYDGTNQQQPVYNSGPNDLPPSTPFLHYSHPQSQPTYTRPSSSRMESSNREQRTYADPYQPPSAAQQEPYPRLYRDEGEGGFETPTQSSFQHQQQYSPRQQPTSVLPPIQTDLQHPQPSHHFGYTLESTFSPNTPTGAQPYPTVPLDRPSSRAHSEVPSYSTEPQGRGAPAYGFV